MLTQRWEKGPAVAPHLTSSLLTASETPQSPLLTSGFPQGKEWTPQSRSSSSPQSSSFFRLPQSSAQTDGAPTTLTDGCWPLPLRGPSCSRSAASVRATPTLRTRLPFSTFTSNPEPPPVPAGRQSLGLPLQSTSCSGRHRRDPSRTTATERRSRSALRSWTGTTGLSTLRCWPSTTATGTARPGIVRLLCLEWLSAALPSRRPWGLWGSPQLQTAGILSNTRPCPTSYLRSAPASDSYITFQIIMQITFYDFPK